MTRNPSDLYKAHVANLIEIQLALSHTSRLARSAIASSDPQHSLQSLLRLHAFLIGAWAECRLCKLLHEEFGFSAEEREHIQKKDSQLEQWQETVDVAFRRHFKITKAPLDQKSLGVTRAAQRLALHDALDQELRIIIEIRNKLAHGQWVYPLNNAGTAIESTKFALINKEDLQTQQFKFALLGYLADIVHDLVTSPKAFERDFETHFRKLSQARTNLVTRDYVKYRNTLIAARKNARAKIAASK